MYSIALVMLLAGLGFTQAAFIDYVKACPANYPTKYKFWSRTQADNVMRILASSEPDDSSTFVAEDPRKALKGSGDKFVCPENFFFSLESVNHNTRFILQKLCFDVKKSAQVVITLYPENALRVIETINFTADKQQDWSNVCIVGEQIYTQIIMEFQNCQDCASEVRGLFLQTCRIFEV